MTGGSGMVDGLGLAVRDAVVGAPVSLCLLRDVGIVVQACLLIARGI